MLQSERHEILKRLAALQQKWYDKSDEQASEYYNDCSSLDDCAEDVQDLINDIRLGEVGAKS